MDKETAKTIDSKILTFLQTVKYKLELAILLLDFTIINIRLINHTDNETLQPNLDKIRERLYYRLPQ